VHHHETPTGLRIALQTDLAVKRADDVLRRVYTL
jgi:hypothetical protein